MSDTLKKPTVGFFVTCLVDIMRPRVGFAAVKLLEQAGCEVEVPRSQSCCGQPAYNNGDEANSFAIAKQIIKVFDQFDYVVVPSGAHTQHLWPNGGGIDQRWTGLCPSWHEGMDDAEKLTVVALVQSAVRGTPDDLYRFTYSAD